uniref:hypothetical protein n=1 Tax=Alloprevotella sp. TaxID=1872471 RepID=UPI003FF00281
ATCCLAQNRAEIFLDFKHQGASGEGFLQTKVVQLPKMTKQSGRFLHAAHCKNGFGRPIKRF